MDELYTNSLQRREAFARYGLAMYHAQCVEKSLAILVSSVFNKEFLPSAPDRREEIQNEIFSKTIGRLLKRLEKQITIPPNLARTLDEALQKRNWLAHEYFWERAVELLTTAGRDKIIDELTELSDFFSKLDAHLAKIYGKWTNKIGLSEVAIEEGMKRLIKQNKENIEHINQGDGE
jgi:hypothetical protein